MGKLLAALIQRLPEILDRLFGWLDTRERRRAVGDVRTFRRQVARGEADEVARRLDDLLLQHRAGDPARLLGRLPPSRGVSQP